MSLAQCLVSNGMAVEHPSISARRVACLQMSRAALGRRRAGEDHDPVLSDVAADILGGHTAFSLTADALPTAETAHASGRRTEPRRVQLRPRTASKLYTALLT